MGAGYEAAVAADRELELLRTEVLEVQLSGTRITVKIAADEFGPVGRTRSAGDTP